MSNFYNVRFDVEDGIYFNTEIDEEEYLIY